MRLSYLWTAKTEFIMIQLLLRHWKIAAIAILLALLALSVHWANIERTGRIEATIALEASINDFQELSTKYINSQGDIVTISKAIVLDRANFKKAIKDTSLFWIKKFKNHERAQSAQSFEVSFEPELIKHDTVYVPCKDSIKAWKYHYKDDYNLIESTVLDTPKIEIRDRYYVVVTRNRPKNWFIKFQWTKWDFNGQVTNLNRLIKVDSVQTILVK